MSVSNKCENLRQDGDCQSPHMLDYTMCFVFSLKVIEGKITEKSVV